VIRILVADDHGLVRRGIAQIASESRDIVVAGEASTGEEALELVKHGDFDVVVLDIAMPGRGGLDVIRDIREAKPGIKVIILSMYSEEPARRRFGLSHQNERGHGARHRHPHGRRRASVHHFGGGRPPRLLCRERIRAPSPRASRQTRVPSPRAHRRREDRRRDRRRARLERQDREHL